MTQIGAPKNSWIPIVAAFVLPFVLFVGGISFLLMNPRTEGTAVSPDEVVAPTRVPDEQVYITVRVTREDGSPAPGNRVTFEPVGADRPPVVRESDSAGIATMSLAKRGTIVVRVDGVDEKIRLDNLEQSDRDTFQLVVQVD